MAEKNAIVKVVLDPPGSNPPFHFESNDVPIGDKNVIYFNNAGSSNGFRVRYEIDNSKNPGFFFPTQQKDGNDFLDKALWAAQSSGCPTQACKWPVFEAKDVEDGGRTLVVKNKNGEVENFFYTLRVTDGTNWLDLDPGGANQNNGTSMFGANALLAAGSGLVAGAFIGTYLIAPALY